MSDEALFLEIIISLATIDITLLIFQLFHRLLLKDLMLAFSLQSLRHFKVCIKSMRSKHKGGEIRTSHSILDLRDLVKVLGIGQAKSAHTKGMS